MTLPTILGKEFDFINQISKKIPSQGLGDDCAVIQMPNNSKMLFSVDTFIENVHFDTKYFKNKQIGIKAAESALSDIAAMGSKCLYVLFSISGPNLTILSDISQGIAASLKNNNVKLIGGDTTFSKNIILSLTVIGIAKKPVFRSSAKIKDLVFVSSYCGLSSAGLHALQNKIKGFSLLKKAHTEPKARLDISTKISKIANSIIDVSDGLLSEAYHIANSSNVSIVLELDRLPIHKDLNKFSKLYKLDAHNFILNGGEDFELLYTVSKKNKNKALGFELGYCIPAQGSPSVFLKKQNETIVLKPNNFKHF